MAFGTPVYQQQVAALDGPADVVDRHFVAALTAPDIGQQALADPGNPWQNGTDESFNGRIWDECLNLEWFRSRGGRKSVGCDALDCAVYTVLTYSIAMHAAHLDLCRPVLASTLAETIHRSGEPGLA